MDQCPFPPDSHDSHENRTFPAKSSFNTYSLVTERGGAEKKMKIALFILSDTSLNLVNNMVQGKRVVTGLTIMAC